MTEKTFTRFLTAVTFVLLMMLILMPNANARSNVYDICEEICTEDYYYDQLSGKEMEFYNRIKDSRSEFIANEKVYLGTISCKQSEVYDLVKSVVGNALKSYLCDNPEASLWIDVGSSYGISYSKNIDENEISEFSIYIMPSKKSDKRYHNFNDSDEIETALEEVEKVTKEFVESLSDMSDEEKLFRIHEWLLDGLKYDEAAPNTQNIYGTIIEKRAVCGGFSYAFKYVADLAEIQVVTTIGQVNTSRPHAWNYVYMNGKWYVTDITASLQYKEKGIDYFILSYYLGGKRDDFLKDLIDIFCGDDLLEKSYIMLPLEKAEGVYTPCSYLNVPKKYK